jgi:hypothetical protein
MRNLVRRLIFAAVMMAGLSPVVAQQFPTVPSGTFLGRSQIGSGPSQAIPFTSFPWTLGSNPVKGGANGQLLYDNNGRLGEYTLSAAQSYLGVSRLLSAACSSHEWFSSIVAGVPACTQPSFSDLLNSISVSQMNSGTNASASTMFAGDNSWKQPQAMPYTPLTGTSTSETMQGQMQKIPVSCEDYPGGCTTANIQQAMTDAVANGRCFQFNGTYTTTATISLVAANSNPCFTGKGGLKGPSSGVQTAVLEIKNFTGMTVDGNITIDCNGNAFIGAGLKIWSSSSGSSAQFHDVAFSEYANCRQAIQIGDPSESTLPISEITISRGFTFNVAQPVRVWSSQAVLNSNGFTNISDPHSSGTWALSATGTCSGSQITLSSASANSYFDQYDVISGTGITAGTYITGQASGAVVGSNGVYNLSASCTSSAAAITGEKRGINYWTSGGNVSVTGGETLNAVVSNGFLCVTDVMASPNQYGYCNFTGGVVENAGSLAASFNPTGIGSPVGGAITFTGGVGGSTSNTTATEISTDSSFPGTIAVLGARFTAGSSRSGSNIVASNSATKIYFDLPSFGTNYLQGYAGVSGGTQYMIGNDGQASATVVTGSATQNPGDTMVVFACSATCTYTMLNPATYPGRELMFTNAAAVAVNSASSNIVTTGGAGTSSILAATIGKFVRLRSDVGSSAWRTTASN